MGWGGVEWGAGHLRRKFNIRLYIFPRIYLKLPRAGPRGGHTWRPRATDYLPGPLRARGRSRSPCVWEREVCVWTVLSIRLLSLRSSFYSVKPGVVVLIALLEADVAPALQLLLWCLCTGRLVLVLLVLPHSFAVVAVQDSQVKFATNLCLPHPPPPSLSLYRYFSLALRV